ncbi:MAG: glycosyltransferase family A protein, partial [Phycisphaeraceae bacterium]
MNEVGVVAIGRNEGERLKRCLAAAVAQSEHVVYVDSGSTDGSVEYARSLGVEVVDLDLSKAFTAARARNAGYRKLVEVAPQVRYVQFVDGDCEMVEGYLSKAVAAFEENDRFAVVSGRRRERHRDAAGAGADVGQSKWRPGGLDGRFGDLRDLVDRLGV